MKDFLNNDLSIGDNVLINQNTLTGSSTVRKILKQATVTGFTKCKIKTTRGDLFPDDVIKIYVLDNKPIEKCLQNQKAIECLKDIRQDVLVDNYKNHSVDLNYLFELIDNKIKELEGKEK